MGLDLKLLDRIISGDKNAAEYLICIRCIAIIEYYLRCFFDKDQMELEEAINEIYLFLAENDWHRLKQFAGRNGASLKTYISTIVRNYFLNEKYKMEKSLVEKEGWNDSIIDKIPDDNMDFEKSMDLQIRVKETMKRMPNKRYKFILYQNYFENRTPKEIAEKLGISLAVYYNKFRLAKKQFEEIYKNVSEDIIMTSNNRNSEKLLEEEIWEK
jgi:RNA polymerase sigma factor (sigma-70 family)